MLLLLSVFLAFARADKLKVVLFPGFSSLYVSDEITLRCQLNSVDVQNGVKWFHKSERLSETSGKLSFTATLETSGQYACEADGSERSNDININVLNMVPPVQLFGGKAVINKHDAVQLSLYVPEGLQDWWCRFAVDFTEFWVGLPIESWSNKNRTALIGGFIKNNSKRTTYWCMNIKSKVRSNAITLRATERIVMLQVPEDPVMEGDSVTLLCEVWGGPHVDTVVFYKNGRQIQSDTRTTFTINNITESYNGSYKCDATYKYAHISKDAATHTGVYSDEQVLRIIAAPPPAAALEYVSGKLRCNCPQCQSVQSYRWYRAPPSGAGTLEDKTEMFLPQEAGPYACRAELNNGLSRLSNVVNVPGVEDTQSVVWIMILVVLAVLMGLCLLGVAGVYRRRTYNQMFGGRKEKKLEDGADGGYELINVKDQGEGDYEPLKGPQAQEYHTLKGKGEVKGQGEGQYEPLKGPQAQVYHTLKGQGEVKGQDEGDYELLKGPQAQEYHTLKGQGEVKGQGKVKGQGEGDYEPLKGPQAQEYHTLKGQGEGKSQDEGQTAQIEVHHTAGQDE